jgi:hypothetical protein
MSDMKVTVEDQLAKINMAIRDIDQLLIPSTINNFINQRFIFKKEKKIISIFEECDAVVLNYTKLSSSTRLRIIATLQVSIGQNSSSC